MKRASSSVWKWPQICVLRRSDLWVVCRRSVENFDVLDGYLSVRRENDFCVHLVFERFEVSRSDQLSLVEKTGVKGRLFGNHWLSALLVVVLLVRMFAVELFFDHVLACVRRAR